MNFYSDNRLPGLSTGLGSAIQHLHYLPFGEEQIDQRLTNFNSRYTFSAKEKDIETGYSYFGARYYTSDLSIWLSVDPLSDKYPSLTPYNYCANNPVILVDPDGRDYETVVDEENKTITIKATYYTSNENKEELGKALKSFNDQSGQYSYKVGHGKNKKEYTVNFKLSIGDSKNGETADQAFQNDNSGKANFFQLAPNLISNDGEDVKGECKDGNVISLDVRYENRFHTARHEIGHSLGMFHKNGTFMESSVTTNQSSRSNIRHVIKGMYSFSTVWGSGSSSQIGKCANRQGGIYHGRIQEN